MQFPRPITTSGLSTVYSEDGTLESEMKALGIMMNNLKQYNFSVSKNLFSYAWKTMNSFRNNKPPRNLGLIGIDSEDFASANISLYYVYLEKAQARRHDQPKSAWDIWNIDQEKLLQLSVEAYASFERGKDLMQQSKFEIEKELSFRIRSISGPGLFPANLAVGMYKKYNAKSVLDMCAGWGDRLIAACAADISYLGVDPNSKLVSKYAEMVKDWGSAEKHRVVSAAFEDLVWTTDDYYQFDMLLTSPPFHNLEIYSDEETQCSHRYQTTQDWFDAFLFPSLRVSVEKLLKPKAVIVIHLNDIIVFGQPQKNQKLVEPMIDFMTRELHCELLGQYGFATRTSAPEQTEQSSFSMRKKQKTNFTFNKDGFKTDLKGVVLAQPLFVFQKQ